MTSYPELLLSTSEISLHYASTLRMHMYEGIRPFVMEVEWLLRHQNDKETPAGLRVVMQFSQII